MSPLSLHTDAHALHQHGEDTVQNKPFSVTEKLWQ